MIKVSLKRKTVPVELETEAGVVEPFELREMSAAASGSYLDFVSQRMRLDAAGKPVGINKFEGFHAELVSRCLFTKDGRPVPMATIQQWPSSVTMELFKSAQELNGLGKQLEEVSGEAKKA